MPRYRMAKGSLTVIPKTPSARNLGYLTVLNPDCERQTGEITLDPKVGAAGRSSHRVAGIVLQVDTGAGLQTIPKSEYSTDSVTITESIESWSDVLTFSRMGADWSPWVKALIRSKRRVVLYLRYGRPGETITRKLFDGYISESGWDEQKKTATITCLDAGLGLNEIKTTINEPPNHGKTRYELVSEKLDEHGIAIGDLDLGPLGYKPLSKPIARAEEGLLDYFRSLLAPCGVWIYFAEGKLNISRYTSDDVVLRTIRAVDLTDAGITTGVPNTATSNAVEVVTVKYELREASGYRTVVTEEVQEGWYQAKGARFEQNHVSGVQTPVNLDGVYEFQEIGKTRTVETFLGDTIVRSEVTRKAFGSPLAVANQVSFVDGSVGFYDGATRYQYEDGTWHAQPRETYDVQEKTVKEWTYDENGFLTGEIERHFFYHWIERAIYEIDGDVIGTNDIPITEEGNGVLSSSVIQQFASRSAGDQTVETEHTLGESGAILQTVVTTTGYSKGAPARGLTARGYGLAPNTKYYTRGFEEFGGVGGVSSVTTTHRQISEDQFRHVEVTVDAAGRSSRRTWTTTTPEYTSQIQGETHSQEIRHTAKDEVRGYLNGVLTRVEHSELCENEDEVAALAQHMVRELGAWPINLEIPLEGQLHKAQLLAIDIPKRRMDNAKVFVTGVTRTFGTCRQPLKFKYYPREIA
jgi:hypothetical protein